MFSHQKRVPDLGASLTSPHEGPRVVRLLTGPDGVCNNRMKNEKGLESSNYVGTPFTAWCGVWGLGFRVEILGLSVEG